MEVYFAILALVISWGYSIFCLFNGRKISYEISPLKKPYILIAYGILSFLIVFRLKSFFGIICAALMFVSGLLYNGIPSGFNKEALYISGRKYLFTRMKDVMLQDCKLSFIYGRKRLHVLEVEKDDKQVLETCYRMIEERRNKK